MLPVDEMKGCVCVYVYLCVCKNDFYHCHVIWTRNNYLIIVGEVSVCIFRLYDVTSKISATISSLVALINYNYFFGKICHNYLRFLP